MQQIIALGGGGFSMEPENLALDQYIVQQAAKPRPKVCFLPTASGDPEPYMLNFYKAFVQLNCIPAVFSIFRPPTRDFESYLLEQDVLYVGGGSTRAMLALWREFDLPVILRKALDAGVVLSGISAGANCWFEACSTDSMPGALQGMPCLGFLRGSFSPHYNSEPERRPAFHAMIGRGDLMDGYAADDSVGMHFINGELHAVIASQPGRDAYMVVRNAGQVEETVLPAILLGPP